MSTINLTVFNPPNDFQQDRDQNTAGWKQLLVGIKAEASLLHQRDATYRSILSGQAQERKHK